jgi:hypothetical protein
MAEKIKKPWKTGDPEGSAGITDPKYSEYAKKYPDLMKDYNKNWKKGGALSKGGITLAEYGAMHFHTAGQDEGRTLGKKKEKKKDPKKEPEKTTPGVTTKPTTIIKKTTPAAEPRPTYQGPAYDPNESITPVGITLKPVEDDEFVENRIANMLDKNSPLFRNASEARLRAMASSGLGRNSSMANEEVMRALFAVVGPIAEADARMLERHRTLNNTAYYQQMNTRLSGVIQKTLAHIAGGYDIQAATMKDITDRWRAQLDSDIKEYGIDVSAATQLYATDMGWKKTKYVTDMQERLGMEGIKISAAQILAGIEDNAEASAYIWRLIFGDNISPGDWVDKWKKKWESE